METSPGLTKDAVQVVTRSAPEGSDVPTTSSCRPDLLALFGCEEEYCESPHIVDRILQGREVILYGAGRGLSTFAASVLRRCNIRLRSVLDAKFQPGDRCLGAPAWPPVSYCPTKVEQSEAIVVITVGKRHYHTEIRATLAGLGFQNVIMAQELYEYHLVAPPDELERMGFTYFLHHRHEIEEAYALLADDLSREVFLGVLATHMLRTPLRIPAHDVESQYFPNDIRLAKGVLRLINCGSFDGDTIQEVNRRFGKINALACFEPDPASFEKLKTYLSAHASHIADFIAAFPCGVFDREAKLCFSEGESTQSCITTVGSSVIQCVAMDHVLPGFRPTYINMDIEGAEVEALNGAQQLIRESRPDLAVCVYHSPGHLWEVPLFLSGLKVGYRTYLRNYSSSIYETVAYAVTE